MSPTIRRLMKEAAELSASSPSPSPHFCAHPVSDSNLFDWHFTMAGPPAPSLYANGIYHGRIVLPPQYPLRPPSFRFLTPSGRFEVNREICLSISGHHEEMWQPAWGIRTALTAIRSFMDGDAKGQLGGLDATDEARRRWAEKSRSWRCDVCAGGKTNEEILAEWREVCREKGIAVDKEGREVVPDELRLHYRKPQEQPRGSQLQSITPTPDAPTMTQNRAIGGVPTPDFPLNPEAQPSNQTQEPTPSVQDHTRSSCLAPASSTNAQHSRHSSTSTFDSRKRSAASPSASPSTSPAPNSTQPQRVVVQSSDGPWLDRAIIGILITLIFMILRKITNTEPI